MWRKTARSSKSSNAKTLCDLLSRVVTDAEKIQSTGDDDDEAEVYYAH
jgi:hypothetical protein